jgi:hypothetical protein
MIYEEVTEAVIHFVASPVKSFKCSGILAVAVGPSCVHVRAIPDHPDSPEVEWAYPLSLVASIKLTS